MIEVIHDSLWNELLTIHTDIRKTNAVWKLRRGYDAIELERKRKSCKLITYIPPSMKGAAGIKGTIAARCGATTLAGKPCPFRATCGKFCKKHVV